MNTDNEKQKAVVIAGPTASGKSSCAVALCHLTGGAVLSMDSMQIYRRMNIGTAKVTKEEMQGVRHYLIDILDPDEPCSISDFQQAADEALSECKARGVLPVLAGGTGFYLHAVMYGNEFGEDTGADESMRESLMAFARENGEKNYEGAITDLQMQTYLVVKDFKPRQNKKGVEYGWAVAIMTPPEYLWGYKHVTGRYKESPGESLFAIEKQIRKHFECDEKTLKKFLK